MNPLPLIRRWWGAPFVRAAVWGALGLAGVVGGVALAYELALARVPQHRARLERLVRAHTGLDVRFNELNLRWGWYGPEAVFHRVELGEPGRSNVLVRAPQLVVGFDAWRSVQSGRLQAGRITFVAPDINLERRPEEARAANTMESDSAMRSRTRLLQRWRGGRIEFEGGTLRLPDPGGSADALTLQVRRASLRRTNDQWSASALFFLPERLGHAVRVAAQFEGDLTRPGELKGSLRFDGLRLAFAGWRQVFGHQSAVTRRLPASGSGDVMFRIAFDRGDFEKADGRVHAQEVSFSEPPWFLEEEGIVRAGNGLSLPRLRGVWRLAHKQSGWQLRVDELDLGAQESRSAKPNVSLDVAAGARSVRGTFGDTPLESLVAVTSWLAPEVDLRGIRLDGIAQDLRFDWNEARPEGSRLQASARAEEVAFAPPSLRFALEGLKGALKASEKSIDLVVDTDKGRLALARAAEKPLEDLRIVSELRLSREGEGWHLSTPLFTVDHGMTQLILSGSLTKAQLEATPWLDVRATLVRADVAMLQELLHEEAMERFGAVIGHLTAGRVERAQFQMQTHLREGNEDPAPELRSTRDRAAQRVFAGTLALRDGLIAAGELWPELQGLDARVDWNGDRIEANVERAHAGSIELDSAQALWSTTSLRMPPRITGQARGRLEDALQWLGAHPRLEAYTPRLRDFAASGDALFNFDVTLPAAVPAVVSARNAARNAIPPPAAHVRVAALLDGARLHLTRDLPAIESVRGSLAFDAGKLQKSTLTGRWLGGPVTLRVNEKRERKAVGLSIQAQGLLDAQQLVALTGFDPLPEVSGETPWSGELSYLPEESTSTARWQLDADASLIGVGSKLPEPLGKAVVTAVPLRVEASGSGIEAQMDITLGNRLRSQLALVRAPQGKDPAQPRWRVERGAVNFGTGTPLVPSEPLIAVHGEVDRFDLPAYASLWQRAGNLANVPAIVADLIAQQLWLAGRSFPGVRVQARKASGSPAEISLDSPEITGSVRWPAQRPEVRLTAQNLDADERARIVTQLEESWSDSIVTVN